MILKSGIGQTANWKAQMFTFINEDEVWLHCDIQACNTKEEDCTQVCEEKEQTPFSVSGTGPKSDESEGSRKKRSANVFTISQKRVKRDDSNVVKNSQVYSLINDRKIYGFEFCFCYFLSNFCMNQTF